MESKGKSLKKWFFRLTAVFSIFVLLVVGGMLYFYYNQEKLINPLVRQINNQLDVEVGVADIHISFRQFPNVSVAFRDVFIPEALPNSKDTLAAIETLYLVFRPWDLLRDDDINISSIRLENGQLNLKILKDGTENFRFWKTDEADEESGLSLGLQSVEISSVELKYQDFADDIYFTEFVKSVVLSGNFTSERLELKGKANVLHRTLKLEDFSYDLPVKIVADFLVEQEEGHTLISTPALKFDDTGLTLKILLDEQGKDIFISGNHLDAQKLKALMPSSYKETLNWFNLRGELDMEFVMALPAVGKSKRQLTFALRNGHFIFLDRDLHIRKVETQGELLFGHNTRSRNGLFILPSFQGEIDGGSFTIDLEIEDFDRPLLTLHATAGISLFNAFALAGIDTLEDVEGNARFDVHFQNRFQSLSQPVKRDFSQAKASGELVIEDGGFSFKNNPTVYRNIAVRSQLKANDLQLDHLHLKTYHSDFTLSGTVKNILPFLLLPEEKISVDANLRSKRFVLDELLSDEKSEGEEAYILEFPKNVSAKLQTRIDTFDFGKFRARSCTGEIVLSHAGLQANFSQMNALDGVIEKLGIKIDARQTPYHLSTHIRGREINMNKMFSTFKNFGQDVITANELHGTLTADIRLESDLTPSLDLPVDRIQADAELTIDRGRLVNFAPMEALSRFAKMDELNDVRFDKLSNTLRIDKGVIYIPAMDIKSNVVDLELEGTHDFENIIDYTIRMDLRELLFTERKRKKSDFDNIMVIKSEGGARLWVRMTGPVSDPKVALDNSQIRSTIREQLREQGQQLRREEPVKQQQYEFEWE
ncbi:MAG: hypothetical protein JJU02_05595 [Cryomorphaceae bacterium]|nr:hypothetical protein [Cryomorphaceae bacterium]